MHDVHPNELARLVHTVNFLVKRLSKLEEHVELDEAAISPKATQDDGDKQSDVEDQVRVNAKEISTLKMRIGELSHRASTINTKANTIKADLEKLQKEVELLKRPAETPSEATEEKPILLEE